MHLMFIKSVYTSILILCIKSTIKKRQEFYFIIRFHIPSDYFEVNAGSVQISSMRVISVSTGGQRTEASLT